MTQEVALLGGLFNAFLWGSWAVFLKKLDGYPLDAFFVVLYISSFLLVWSIALIVLGEELFREFAQVWRERPAAIVVALVAGATFVIGVRITLTVFDSIGLAVTAPIQSFMNLILGTSLAVLLGGLPVAISMLDLFIVCIFFLAASLTTIWASLIRDDAGTETAAMRERPGRAKSSKSLLLRNILLAGLSSVIITSYPLGLSFSLRTPSREFGLTPLPYIVILVTGSLLSVLLTSGTVLTVRRQWPILFRAKWTVQRYSVMAAGAHYGGNIINAFATGTLTAAVSWPLGTTSQLWTYIWGLASGEFKDAPRKSYLLIGLSAILFVAGIIYLRWALLRAA